jgi:hypothetical protein
LGQPLAVFQAFGLAKLRILKVAFPKTEVLEQPHLNYITPLVYHRMMNQQYFPKI